MAWNVDLAHTQVFFAIRHLGISLIRGSMRVAEAELSLNEERPEESRVVVLIDAASLDTKDATRDGHLKTADFLNVEQFPHIKFMAEKVEHAADGRFRLAGNLTVRDSTRPVVLEGEYSGPVDDPISGKRKIGFSLSGDLTQKEWGIDWNVPMSGGFMLADRVHLTIDAQAIEA
jgi:polyisoprenoid-binding protein YceI